MGGEVCLCGNCKPEARPCAAIVPVSTYTRDPHPCTKPGIHRVGRKWYCTHHKLMREVHLGKAQTA